MTVKAYKIVRKHSRIFINLFLMMLSTGLPQLRSIEDIGYLRESFQLNQKKEELVETQWKVLLMESLNSKSTAINFFIHNLAHPD